MEFARIHKNLANDPRLGNRTTTYCEEFFVKSKPAYHPCVVRLYLDFTGAVGDIIFCNQPHCEGCTKVFAASLPPTGTFLQRRGVVSIGVLPAGRCAPSCILCYRVAGQLSSFSHVCHCCSATHEQQKNEIVRTFLFARQIFGPDIGWVIAGILPRIFFLPLRQGQRIQEHFPADFRR
jgi:hypothetical protein